jgi:hypothetical protein
MGAWFASLKLEAWRSFKRRFINRLAIRVLLFGVIHFDAAAFPRLAPFVQLHWASAAGPPLERRKAQKEVAVIG